jgi:hypothetical protein
VRQDHRQPDGQLTHRCRVRHAHHVVPCGAHGASYGSHACAPLALPAQAVNPASASTHNVSTIDSVALNGQSRTPRDWSLIKVADQHVARAAEDVGNREHAQHRDEHQLRAGKHAGKVGQMWEQRIALEHGMDRPLLGRRAGQVAAVEQNLAGIRQVEAGDHAQDGGLAAAGRPPQREELAACHREADVFHRLEIGETACDVANLEQGHGLRPE